MAARSEYALPRVVDLRQLRSDDLVDLLAEETDVWSERLDWDFQSSAELVRRFIDMQALTGYALVAANRVVGYTYYVCEERKGLIGDLYVLAAYRTAENEDLLLESVVDALSTAPWVKRIESQLMMLGSSFDRVLPMAAKVRVYPRTFMEIDATRAAALAAAKRTASVTYDTWSERRQDEAAQVIAACYDGHIDSDINDQYRSPGGARRFLLNIVQYPGCGVFLQPASFIAFQQPSGRMCGLCLSSLVSAQVGHITQICTLPDARGLGVGYELLRRSLTALAGRGCRKVSLTVTTANRRAIELYERVGFRARTSFAAYVWEGF
jgi:ribosomal protein S18 acetylase RimI-like enzyme